MDRIIVNIDEFDSKLLSVMTIETIQDLEKGSVFYNSHPFDIAINGLKIFDYFYTPDIFFMKLNETVQSQKIASAVKQIEDFITNYEKQRNRNFDCRSTINGDDDHIDIKNTIDLWHIKKAHITGDSNIPGVPYIHSTLDLNYVVGENTQFNIVIRPVLFSCIKNKSQTNSYRGSLCIDIVRLDIVSFCETDTLKNKHDEKREIRIMLGLDV